MPGRRRQKRAADGRLPSSASMLGNGNSHIPGFWLKGLSGLTFSKLGTAGIALRRRSRTRQPSRKASATA